VAVNSNAVYRGETISDDDPAITLAVGYDNPTGFYLGADASVAAGAHDPLLVASSQYAGYTFKSGKTSIEFGLVHHDYRELADVDYNAHYSEAFVGLRRGKARMRIYVSPDYLKDGGPSYYGEVEAQLLKVSQWSLQGRAGLSVIPSGAPGAFDVYYDWSVQASRSLGKLDVGLGVTGSNYPVFGSSGSARFFASVSRAF